jgi:hypothetical protein
MIWLVEAKSFTQAFFASYGLWTIINWYDCFILDWVFFANVKSVRLPGTEHMDKEYHQKTYHFIRSLWGMLVGFIPCIFCSVLFTLLFL